LDAVVAVDFKRVERGTEAEGTVRLVSGPAAAEAGAVEFSVRAGGDNALAGRAQLRVADARSLRPILPAVASGSFRGEVRLAGTLDAPTADGTLVADELVLAGTRFELIGGNFEVSRKALVAKPLELRAVGGTARLEGLVGLGPDAGNDWALRLEHVDLSALWIALDSAGYSLPYTTGSLDGTATARGAWSQGGFSGRLVTSQITVGTARFGGFALQAEAKAQQWTLDVELFRHPDEVVRVAGAGTGFDKMWLSAWSTPWQVAGFRFLKDYPQPGGEVVFSADLYGRPDAPLGKVQLTVSDLSIGGRSLGSVDAEVHSLPNGVLQLLLGDREERLLVEGELRSENGRPFSLRADLREFDLAHILAPQQPVTMVTHGQARAEGRLSDLAGSLTGAVTLSRFELGRDALRMVASAPIVISAAAGRLKISSFNLHGDFGTVSVSGDVGLDGSVALDVRADADARVAEAIPKTPVRWASGSASLLASIRRSVGGAVTLAGRGAVDQFSVDIGLPFLLTDTNGNFVLDGSRIELDHLRGHADGGDFILSGYIDVVEGPRLHWEAIEMSSGFLDWLQDEVSGKGEIRGSWDAVVIAGDVRVLSALYDREVELTDLLPIFRRELGPTPPKPGEKPIYLDLNISAPDSIFIDNNVAKAEFRADLHVGGTDLAPLLNGEVELLDGEATLFDRRFQVTLGRVNFDGRPKINPALEFSANADVSTAEGEYNIIAQVGGTLDDPRVKLSADDSSLTTNDVAMLLSVGKTMAQLQSEGSGVSVGDLASLAPVLYRSPVERSVKRFLPIDRFSLEPGFSRTTGDFEPKVMVGADLARNLRGTLSTTIGATTQNAVQLEYQLTPTMLVIGSWESRTETSAGGFGGGIKFRYRFRYLPRFSLLPPEWRGQE